MKVASVTRAFGAPFMYIQGPGEFANLAALTNRYGTKCFVLIDGFLFDAFENKLEMAFAGTESSYQAERFGGECCQEEIDRLIQIAKTSGAQVVVGVGGGKTLDTVKLLGDALAAPKVIVPTAASTDAPTSALSVIYTSSGEHVACLSNKRGSDIVLVDSEIIAQSPPRLFVAGMGDALSTVFEARANQKSDTANYIGTGYRRTLAAMAIAETCYQVLMRDGLQAKLAQEKGLCTEAVENVIEANILLSGLGFENTGCAGAHAIHTGLSEIPSAHSFLHGEKVAFGCLFQLALENAPWSEMEEVFKFCYQLGLPITLAQMNVKKTPGNMDVIARRIADSSSGIDAEPFCITDKQVHDAILMADLLGERYITQNGFMQ